MAALISLCFFFIFGKRCINILKNHLGGGVRKWVPETHNKKSGTPSMGGILIFFSVLVAMIFSGNFQNSYVLMLLICYFLFSLIGFADDFLKETKPDRRGLRGKYKIFGQLAIGLGMGIWLYFFNKNDSTTLLAIPFTSGKFLNLGIWYIPFVAFVFVSSSNAVNITDGLDGLAIGLTLLIFITFTIFAYLSGHKVIAQYLKIFFIVNAGETAVFGSALAGACLGFLWFNSHPAQIIMGDTGAISLGGIIGVMAVMLKQELLLPLAGGVFAIETISVIIQIIYYKLTKKRFFKMAPLHHHFELSGWHESKVIIRLWILGAICSLLALSTLKIR